MPKAAKATTKAAGRTANAARQTFLLPSADVPAKDHTKTDAALKMVYPRTQSDRAAYRRDGKALSDFRWRLYDLVETIPAGKVTTYGKLAAALGNNPWAPRVPCHRIVSAQGYIGGFGGAGSWGLVEDGRSKTGEGASLKMKMLTQEGVHFNEKGYMIDKSQMWTPPAHI